MVQYVDMWHVRLELGRFYLYVLNFSSDLHEEVTSRPQHFLYTWHNSIIMEMVIVDLK